MKGRFCMEIIRYRTIEFYPNLLFETEIVIDNVIYYLSINVEKNKLIRTNDFEWCCYEKSIDDITENDEPIDLPDSIIEKVLREIIKLWNNNLKRNENTWYTEHYRE